MQSHTLIEQQLEKMLDDISQQGFSIVDALHPEHYVQSLRDECVQHLTEFRKAGIQNGVMTNIRSDDILWIDENLHIAQHHLQTLNELSTLFNRNFYLNIQQVEAHFACYQANTFYALHRDNPQQKNNRIISAVYYLNKDWEKNHAGELRLQDKNGDWHIIEPIANRLVIFQSDLLHEVQLAKQQRLSITAWLRSLDSTLL